MVRHTQTICGLLPTNCLSAFDHFVGLALKVLKGSSIVWKVPKYGVFSGPYFPVFRHTAGSGNTDQKKLRIWTMFMQYYLSLASLISLPFSKSKPRGTKTCSECCKAIVQKMKFSIKEFFSKYGCRFGHIYWRNL